MSSYKSSSYADPRPRPRPRPKPQSQPSLEKLDDACLNEILGTSDIDTSFLFSYNFSSHTTAYSASPPNYLNGTPAEDISDYSTYQPSEQYSDFTDEFCGVNFEVGVHRVGSLPSTLTNGAASQSVKVNKPLPDLPRAAQPVPSPGHLRISKFPPSPVQSTSPSPISGANEAKSKIISSVSQRELTKDLHNLRIPKISSFMSTQSSSLQLTPDHSGSSHTSGEGFEPSIMAPADQSPLVTISQWEFEQSPTEIGSFAQHEAHYQSLGQSTHIPEVSRGSVESTRAAIARDDEGQWKPHESTGQGGLDPESRKLIAEKEVPNLKEQEEQRRIERKNSEVEEWRSQAGDLETAEVGGEPSCFSLRHRPTDESSLAPVDDAASIRDNRLLEGQTYFHVQNNAPTPPTKDDLKLMNQPRQFNDPPSLPYITDTKNLPPTANDAIRQWNGTADTFSLSSRAATWGTRRKSEPSLKDYESIADGSFLKKLSISKPASRQNSLFDQGLDRLASIVRKKSDTRLKRARSTQNIPEDPESAAQQQRNNSQGSLLSLPRTPSFGRRPTPSINNALAAMTGPLAAVGTTHARSGSFSGLATSPKSPSHLGGFASRVIQRARSRSELSTHDRAATPSLVGLLRGHGGPPVANLASGSEVKSKPRPEAMDLDDDDEEDDDQADEGDMRAGSEANVDIVPNYEGFKAHVRKLNPAMESRYHWLVSRIAHQQEIRYKNLLEMRVKHSQATRTGICPAGSHCMALGGSATLLDPKGKIRDPESHGLQFRADVSDDSNPGEGALTDETFPAGVPMPPTRNLPAEFECQLCFKTKKFQKPSDWTKHVHEDGQPFTCTYEKCKEPKSFKRKADWVRHENERHRHLEWWVCQMDDCRHPCYRKDNFLQHLVREHKLPEPKQKTKAAIKKARTTEIAWVMLERCHHDTENKPQDEPCKFCGKTFTIWKKLTVHLAKHMEHISLPVLRLVEQRKVDADTVISPVEQNLTPITPVGVTKFESTSPLGVSSQPTSMLPRFSGFEQPTFFTTTTGPSQSYRLQAPMPQEVYDQNLMFAPPYGSAQPMGQSRAFGSMDSSNLSQMDQSRPFGSMDSNYSHTTTQNYNVQQPADYSMQQQYTSGPSPVSGYQTSNMLGMGDTGGYNFNPVGPSGGQNYQQMPMSRSTGSTSPYGTDNSPHNVHYYSQ